VTELVLEPLEAFLDGAGLGSGPLDAGPIGDGHSNLTYRLRRGAESFVLRRPPEGPLPPSAHDVVREARLLEALGPTGLPVPEVLAVCDDEAPIGAPFYVMSFVDGHVLTKDLPPELAAAGDPQRIGEELVDKLIALGEIDLERNGLSSFGRPSGYLERQLRRFSGLLEHNATRPLPKLETVAHWLEQNLPDSPPATVVHGDYRLGNVMFSRSGPHLTAILDWEMATIGDPLADIGYMTAMWAQAGDPPHPVGDLSPVTRLGGFPVREALARRYAEGSGRSLTALPWYQALALWKAAIFLEGSYRRHLAGSTSDPYFAGLGAIVEDLGRLALERTKEA
jgi:aminoglycoside phosphotransferase (APT) family kinase protein